MAQENETSQAGSGTDKNQKTITGCPAWENAGQEQLPFFNPTEEMKREGLRVKFITDGPRKETINTYDRNHPKPELWFDVEINGMQMTWTISQVTLISELKKNAPLKGKTFEIKLVPVTEDFRKDNPKYKGKDIYEVKVIKENDPEPVSVEDIEGIADKEKAE